MDMLREDTGKLYRHYLIATFGSALVLSIYSLVDTAMVGWYAGPEGAAAMSVVSPLWNFMYSLGMLSGMGGAVLYSVQLGSPDKKRDPNEYFTAALILTVLSSILCMVALHLFEVPLLRFFGANDTLLEMSVAYMKPICCVAFLAPFYHFLSAFLCNDNAPGLATCADIFGGVVNIIGDWLLVFVLDMGVFGAGLASAAGMVCSVCCMLLHFLQKKCGLRVVRPYGLLEIWRSILREGFSTFFADLSAGILTVLFNRQIMAGLGENALAVYGAVGQVMLLIEWCGFGIGQASQPLISVNFGAGEQQRVYSLRRHGLITLAAMSAFWLVLSIAFPQSYIYIFMTPTAEVLAMAPGIIRQFSLAYPTLLFNVYSTYYFQSVLRPKEAMLVSVGHSLVVSGALVMLLPAVFGANSIWLAVPVAEAIVMVYAAKKMFSGKRMTS